MLAISHWQGLTHTIFRMNMNLKVNIHAIAANKCQVSKFPCFCLLVETKNLIYPFTIKTFVGLSWLKWLCRAPGSSGLQTTICNHSYQSLFSIFVCQKYMHAHFYKKLLLSKICLCIYVHIFFLFRLE